MHNQKHLNDYVSRTTYCGEKDTYNLFKIEVTQMKGEQAIDIKEAFKSFFESGDYLKTGSTKNAVDLSNVDYVDSTGLTALLTLNRLSTNNGHGSIYLVGCLSNVRKLLEVSHLDTIFQTEDRTKDLK